MSIATDAISADSVRITVNAETTGKSLLQGRWAARIIGPPMRQVYVNVFATMSAPGCDHREERVCDGQQARTMRLGDLPTANDDADSQSYRWESAVWRLFKWSIVNVIFDPVLSVSKLISGTIEPRENE